MQVIKRQKFKFIDFFNVAQSSFEISHARIPIKRSRFLLQIFIKFLFPFYKLLISFRPYSLYRILSCPIWWWSSIINHIGTFQFHHKQGKEIVREGLWAHKMQMAIGWISLSCKQYRHALMPLHKSVTMSSYLKYFPIKLKFDVAPRSSAQAKNKNAWRDFIDRNR